VIMEALEIGLGVMIGIILHKKEQMNKQEREVLELFVGRLEKEKRVFSQPVVVAMVGLVGSGKSVVAKELASLMEAELIEADQIRVELRKRKAEYDKCRLIVEELAKVAVKRGYKLVIDSDFIDIKKRSSLREKLKGSGAKLKFIRTYCNFDVAVGRILQASYEDCDDDFFGGATCNWEGGPQIKGAVVKIREMWRRTPLHYRWQKQGWDQWKLRKLPFNLWLELDTANEQWRDQLAENINM